MPVAATDENRENDAADVISSRRRIPASIVFYVVCFAAATTTFEMAAARISAATSDAATALLEGHALDGGHLLLHGWSLSLDSFWALEAAAYALVLPFTGVHLYVLHAVPALLAAAVLFVGIALVVPGHRRNGRLVAIGSLLALLAFPSPVLAYFFLQGPWHVSTTLACFVAFALVAESNSSRRALAAAVVLALSTTSDASAVVIGAGPILVVGICQLARTRRLRSSFRMLLVAPVSILFALLIREVGRGLGMYTLVNRNLVISLKSLRVNLHHLVPHLEALFGTTNLASLAVPRVSGVFVVVRSIELLGVATMLVVGLVGGGRLLLDLRQARAPLAPSRVIEALLLTCFVVDLAFFVIGSANGHVEFTKYLTTAVLALSIASSGLLARTITNLQTPRLRYLGPPGVVLLALSAMQFFSLATHPAPIQKTHQLVSFLESHHLHDGVATYPIASLVTVDSSLGVALRPVIASGDGVVTTFGRQEDDSWYSGRRFDFLVYDTSVPWHDVNEKSAVQSFGRVDRVFAVGPYRVLVFAKRFRVPSNPSPGGSSPLHVTFNL